MKITIILMLLITFSCTSNWDRSIASVENDIASYDLSLKSYNVHGILLFNFKKHTKRAIVYRLRSIQSNLLKCLELKMNPEDLPISQFAHIAESIKNDDLDHDFLKDLKDDANTIKRNTAELYRIALKSKRYETRMANRMADQAEKNDKAWRKYQLKVQKIDVEKSIEKESIVKDELLAKLGNANSHLSFYQNLLKRFKALEERAKANSNNRYYKRIEAYEGMIVSITQKVAALEAQITSDAIEEKISKLVVVCTVPEEMISDLSDVSNCQTAKELIENTIKTYDAKVDEIGKDIENVREAAKVRVAEGDEVLEKDIQEAEEAIVEILTASLNSQLDVFNKRLEYLQEDLGAVDTAIALINEKNDEIKKDIYAMAQRTRQQIRERVFYRDVRLQEMITIAEGSIDANDTQQGTLAKKVQQIESLIVQIQHNIAVIRSDKERAELMIASLQVRKRTLSQKINDITFNRES